MWRLWKKGNDTHFLERFYNVNLDHPLIVIQFIGIQREEGARNEEVFEIPNI